MTKKKLSKLTLRRETLTVLEMKEANGGALAGGGIVLNTVHSVCTVCILYPVIPPQEWPQG